MASSCWHHFKLANYSCIHVQGMKCCLQLNIQREMIQSSHLTYPLFYFLNNFFAMKYLKFTLGYLCIWCIIVSFVTLLYGESHNIRLPYNWYFWAFHQQQLVSSPPLQKPSVYSPFYVVRCFISDVWIRSCMGTLLTHYPKKTLRKEFNL